MRTNYHTHNELCRHANGTIEDYVKVAIQNDYKILGFSDHGPIDNSPFPRMDLDEFFIVYLQDIKRCQIKYKDDIKIYAGLEIEFVYGQEEYYKFLLANLDYLVLGTHYYSGKPGYKSKSSYCVGTKEALEEYADLICDALKTKSFKILAHPDLFMFGYPAWDDAAINASKRILEAAIQNDVYVEYNANGLRRGKKQLDYGEDNYYPNSKFWELAKTYSDLKVVMNMDSHDPKDIEDKWTEEARQNLKRLGITPVENIFD